MSEEKNYEEMTKEELIEAIKKLEAQLQYMTRRALHAEAGQ